MIKRGEQRATVREFRLTPERALTRIRDIAADTSKIILGQHAQERMAERGILDIDIYRILRTGHIQGHIEAAKNKGEWKCKIVKRLRGSRDAGVVTIILENGKLFVKTVEWEDIK